MKLTPNRTLFALALWVAAAGCGSSGNGTTPTAAVGEVTVMLTDAATDELDIFEVDVGNIRFCKSNGSKVSVTTGTGRIDFTELETVSELLVGASLVAGRYDKILLDIDFSNATVCIVDKTTAATVIDKDGNPITGVVEVEIEFARGSTTQVSVGRNRLFVLDLDLNQALSVDATNNRVTFSPVIHADVDPTNPKPVNATGLLQSGDVSAGTFEIQKRTGSGAALADISIATTTTTLFQIDGAVQIGTAGLTALLAMPADTRVWVQGTVNTTERRLDAVAVEAGDGVPGNGQDFVLGHVIGRNNTAGMDPTLTVLGRWVRGTGGVRSFNRTVSVPMLLGTTKVLARGTNQGLDTDDINIGQRVAIFGQLNQAGDTLDARASTAVARLLRTSVFGIAAGAPAANRLTLDVNRIGLRSITRFDFDIGGNAEADPDAFTVDITNLDGSAVTAGSKIRALGWVATVGDTVGADFDALSFVDNRSQGKVLVVQWLPASAAGLTSISSSAITLGLQGTIIRDVGDGFGPVQLQTTPTPQIQPAAALGIYRIVEDGSVEVHLSFETFSQSLAARYSVFSPVVRVGALGTFDETTQVFSALVMSVILN